MPKQELVPFVYPHNLRNRVQHVSDFPDRPLIADGMDEKSYLEAVFDSVTSDDLYIKQVSRPVEGIGAHFDLHNDLVYPDFPYVATYNTSGSAVIQATMLPEDLANYYDSRYPIANNKAKEARRHIGALALSDPESVVYRGEINRGTGLVIPQVRGELPLVHDVAPKTIRRPLRRFPGAPLSAGAFNKYLVPRQKRSVFKALRDEGYKTLYEHQQIQADDRERRAEQIRRQQEVDEYNRTVRRDSLSDYGLPGGGLLD